MTPPEALISVIAIIVASDSDFSMIDKPPVNENSTPTRSASAAAALRWKKYGVASEAARKWRFASAEGEGSRQWLLHFEFGRDGTAVRATRSGS